jgi:hypothetical protein
METMKIYGGAQRPTGEGAGPNTRGRVCSPSASARFQLGQKVRWCASLGLAFWLAAIPSALAQVRPYIGYVYPAGGQQGTTFEARLGGQGLDGVNGALITGSGVQAKIVEYYRRLNNQDIQLLNEQVKELKRGTTSVATAMAPLMMTETPMMMAAAEKSPTAPADQDLSPSNLVARIEKRTREFVQTPACASISTLTLIEVTVAPDAEPGPREIRLATTRGISNPLVFCVGQVPEYARKPMLTATLQVLGKEAQALRKRPASEIEDRVAIPCVVNGQIASGEVNRYRFEARQGQKLVLTTQARQLIPFIADAVPGWFQPVLALYDADGKEVAYDDDYRFKPDPTLFYEVPKDGEYVFEVHDSIYRGREDFVYRVTVGELPFLTSIFPLGAPADSPVTLKMNGWNLGGATLTLPSKDAGPGLSAVVATRKGIVSNRAPFVWGTLPEGFEREPNNDPASAQEVTLPIVINGRINQPDDWDVFRFVGKSNDTVVVEVDARRLDSPLDSAIKLTDVLGKLIAFNDDCEDLGAGANTHEADSYFTARLPADGTYFVYLGDTARKGGEEYAYRLRISPPQPDFLLRAVPSSISLRPNSTATLTLYAARKDGFTGPIKLTLKDPPAGFTALPVTLQATQTMTRLNIKGPRTPSMEPVSLTIVGTAKVDGKEIVREAVPAEDRMQAFLWRHLVPASDLKVLVFDPNYELPPKRIARPRPPSTAPTNAVTAAQTAAAINAVAGTNLAAATNAALLAAANKAKFTKQQVTMRLRQLKVLYEEGLLTDAFYDAKVAECETPQ